MGELSIRPAAPDDFPAIAVIGSATWPDLTVTGAELLARDERRRASHAVRRRVALRDGRIVGWSLAEWSPQGMHHGTVRIWGAILPSARGSGVGSAMTSELSAALRAGGARALLMDIRESHHDTRRFFEARGFAVTMRHAASRLDLQRFEPERFAAVEDRVGALGVQITTAGAMRLALPDAIARINALRWAIAQDVPATQPPVRESDASLANYLDAQPTALPEGWFIARHGDEEIGLTTLWRSQGDPTVVHTGVTGVKRAWRRRGVATALKVEAVRYAQRTGARWLNTDNEEHNPMYALNQSLGFEARPAWLTYRLDL